MSAIQFITNTVLIIMLWATSLNLGMQFTLPQIIAPLRRPVLILVMVVLNLVVIPLLTWGLTLLFPVMPGYASGILLTAFAMAAPMSLKFVQGAKGDVPYAITLVVLLQVLNVLAIPGWAALLLPGGATINPLQVVGTLLFDVLLPLVIGLFIKARYPAQAASWYPGLGTISTWALILVIVLTIVADLPVILSLIGSFALLVSVLLCVISFALGYLLGGQHAAEKRAGAIVTSTRASGPAMLIASQAFPTQPQVLAGVIAVGVFVGVLPMLSMLEWGKRVPREGAPSATSPAPASGPSLPGG